jgi:hypothetical protein
LEKELVMPKGRFSAEQKHSEHGDRVGCYFMDTDLSAENIARATSAARKESSFLLNKIYLGPIDQQLFITTSNRPLA